MSAGVEKRRSKWMPSTRASVVRTCNAPRSGIATAASSPIPTTSEPPAGGTRVRIRSTRARSPASATRSPVALPGELNGARLPDHGHLDLARVFEFILDAARDVLRQPDRLLVGDALAFDDDTDFASGLEREGLGDPFERIGDAFEFFQAFDVRLENVAPGTRARRRDRVGGLYDHCFERRPVDVHVVRGDRHQDRFAFAVLPQEVKSKLQVRALQIAIDRLANVVQERGPRGDVAVEPDFLCHDAGEKCDFLRMVQDVLSVAGSEL